MARPVGCRISDYNQYDLTTGKYVNAPGTNGSSTTSNDTNTNGTGVIITNDLPDGFDRTEMTLQVESSSIGIIYAEYDTSGAPDENASGVGFTPTPYYRKSPRIVMVMTSYLHRRDLIALTKRISSAETLRMLLTKCVEIVVTSAK